VSVDIKDAMSSPAVLIENEASVLDAAKLMADSGVGAVGVTEGGKLSGVITDRDIVVRGIAKGIDASSTQVTDLASTDAVTVSCEDSLEKAEKLMVERRVRRLFVLDQDDIVGVLSNDDVAALRNEQSVEAQQLDELEHGVRRDYQGHTGQGE
jgi:signal-transduction protein with cAMP-binding, CBS, and nucleotidyltransferase domain